MIARKQAREWLVTSALSALWIATLWSLKTLTLDAPDPAFRRSLSGDAQAVPLTFADTLLRRMAARVARFDSLGDELPRPSTPRVNLPESTLAALSAFAVEIREDSTELAAALAFVTTAEDRAWVAALAGAISAEHRKWDRLRMLSRRRPLPDASEWDAALNDADDFALSLVAFMRSSEVYLQLRLERLNSAFDEHQRQARPFLAAIALLIAGLVSLAYLVRIAVSDSPNETPAP